MEQIFLFLFVMGLGYASRIILEGLLKKTGLYKLMIGLLVKSIYYFIMPLAFFTVFLNRGVKDKDHFILLYFLLFILLVYFTLLKGRFNERINLFLVSTFPNSAFLGYPLCQAVLGRVEVAAVFGVITVVLNVLLPELTVRNKRVITRNILGSTALIGFLAGIITHYTLPDYIGILSSHLWWSSTLLSYTATYVMGLRIPVGLRGVSRVKTELLVTGLYRFITAPILALAIAFLGGFNKIDTFELVLVSMTPPAVMNAVVAEKHGWRPEDTALIIAVLTVFFIIVVFPVILLVEF